MRFLRALRELLTHLALVCGALIVLYPLVWIVSSSLKTNSEYFSGTQNLIPAVPQWHNYVKAWTQASFSRYFLNSIAISSSVTLIAIALSCLSGYALGRYRFFGRRAILSLLGIALFLPVSYVIIPIFQLIRSLGLNNTLAGVILAQIGSHSTLFILLFSGYFAGLPAELEDAAEIDGAGFVRVFLMVYLPLAKPIVATTAILRFLWSWNDFFTAMVFTLNTPSLRTVAVGMYTFVGQYSTDYVTMAAAATIALAPTLILFVFFQRYFIDAAAGAVKG